MKKQNFALTIAIALSITACGGSKHSHNHVIDQNEVTDATNAIKNKTSVASWDLKRETQNQGNHQTPNNDYKNLNGQLGSILYQDNNVRLEDQMIINQLEEQLQKKGVLVNDPKEKLNEISFKGKQEYKIEEKTIKVENEDPIDNKNFYNQNMKYAKFGASSFEMKNNIIDPDLRAYSSGAVTKNFEKIKPDSEAQYSGNAIIVATKEKIPQTLFADFNATVTFGKDKRFTGTIDNFYKKGSGQQLIKESNIQPIQLEGLSNTHVENSAISNGNNKELSFKGKFYGDQAQELSGVISGKRDDLGNYYGSFGGKKD